MRKGPRSLDNIFVMQASKTYKKHLFDILSVPTNLLVVARDHVPVGDLLADAVPRLRRVAGVCPAAVLERARAQPAVVLAHPAPGEGTAGAGLAACRHAIG